ncbi:hypothetical protein DPMN_175109 [Dreissena polymorpha]|uniref:Uncharacterized protein n=1 Tax=Dreissena polymorpha TaxID=45954 RepID=A0A9D4E7K5_DREPO|nr:hypothetical protein DPMN_175109 [Dreissena polymorpha]
MAKYLSWTKQTNRQTNRQGKDNMSPTIVHSNAHGHWNPGETTERTATQFAKNLLRTITTACLQQTTNDSALACLSLKSVCICTIFDLIQDIIGTNLRTKFHDDQKINVASRVLTRKNAEPTGSHVFQPISIMFELIQDIIGMNLLTIFHEHRK